MKNVTPKPKYGQFWASIKTSKKLSILLITPDGCVHFSDDSVITMRVIHKEYKFIPQNDLEWLAVNVDSWYFSSKYIGKILDAPFMVTHPQDGAYTREQWQNARYELGLDDKPKQHIDLNELHNKINDQLFPDIKMKNVDWSGLKKLKETKMIDLSKAKVGDEYLCGSEFNGSVVMSVAFIDKSKTCFVLRGDGVGDLFVHENGKTIVSRLQGVIKKHDPRPWLKDLPDADLFNYQWLACDEDGSWYYYSSEPKITPVNHHANHDVTEQSGHLDCIKMPTLTGDQWKQSKISITELREWQETNQ